MNPKGLHLARWERRGTMVERLKTGRRVFLRQAGKALVAGIGVTLLSGMTQASVTCCPDPNCPACGPGKARYRCQGTCPTYCTCHTPVGCYTIPC